MKFLIVDDEPNAQLLLKRYLAPFAECVSAYSARDAFRSFTAAHEQREPFRLICLDIILPDESGFELLQMIREWETTSNLENRDRAIVVIVSRLSDARNVLQGFQFGCGAYIGKPIERSHLLHELKRLAVIDASEVPMTD